MPDEVGQMPLEPSIDVAGRMREIRERVRSGAVDSPSVAPKGNEAVQPALANVGGSGKATMQPLASRQVSLRMQGAGAGQNEIAALRRRARELSNGSGFREFDFPSNVPVAGPLISSFRRAWNGVSTRWYVRHAVLQQAQVNVNIGNLLNDTIRLLGDQVARTDGIQRELDDTRELLKEARLHAKTLEQRLADLGALSEARSEDHAPNLDG